MKHPSRPKYWYGICTFVVILTLLLGRWSAPAYPAQAADTPLHLQNTSSVMIAGDGSAVPVGVAPNAMLGEAPNVPGNPTPADGATDVMTTTSLSWSGGDPDGDPVTYTVAFGTDSSPSVVGAVTTLSYDPGTLVTSTTYYWRITASDGLSTTVGPLWSFATRSGEDFFIYLPLVLRNHGAPAINERLIVFEAFLSIYCGFCQSAAGVIESQLVPEYAGRPVLFLEHDVLLGYTDPRYSRWWDGYQVGGTVGYPLVMVDSGDQVAERFTGGTDFYNLYKVMVDAALAVPEGRPKFRSMLTALGIRSRLPLT